MASAPASERIREEATCSICLNLMAEPLSISCGHSYCQLCIEDFLDKHGHQQQPLGTYLCPQCRAPFRRTSLRPNKQLGNLIEAMKELNLEITCKKHGEQLHLFCEDEGWLICWRCERSPEHKGHVTVLVEDACLGYKKDLQEAVTNLRELEKECMHRKAFVTEQITEWNRKVELQRQKIQADFKDLHSFLQEEEKSYLWRLEQEKEQTLNVLRDNEASLVHKTCELESHIQDLEDRCQGSAQKLLQDVRGALKRSRAMTLDKPEAPSLEIQTVCDVSELYFDVTQMLRDHQVNVTLDPDTAHRGLTLSVDQRQVTMGTPQHDVGKSCGRFTAYPCILGREGFTSGRHYFEVNRGSEASKLFWSVEAWLGVHHHQRKTWKGSGYHPLSPAWKDRS
ncbi:E3 ubiquitin-protein ligase TRIM38 isoform X2 [Rhinolophus ferrumequinum]|uniref:E3 ubiquitin-protein ligase TRIM38 isoform X2 n=1 Tax=Rhinolophus ferrumequinum TaxID=59479 RepID=UPI00140FDC6E|nr:E3 ubiquitin-protein ligase TRIM38 isoform X2 [Rhinolophus ferrumequinum]XP_032949767.1 E3 ubiquitin-protein ligase TRIM38 isoform X2 [Rhinolophus ferrumequinum]